MHIFYYCFKSESCSKSSAIARNLFSKKDENLERQTSVQFELFLSRGHFFKHELLSLNGINTKEAGRIYSSVD